MTKAQRKVRAKRAGAVRRKANAVKAFMKRMNPGKKAPVAVRVKRLRWLTLALMALWAILSAYTLVRDFDVAAPVTVADL